MEVEVVGGIRVQVRNEGLCVLVESSGGLVVNPWAVAVAHNVVVETSDGEHGPCESTGV